MRRIWRGRWGGSWSWRMGNWWRGSGEGVDRGKRRSATEARFGDTGAGKPRLPSFHRSAMATRRATMKPLALILSSARYYWRTHLGVVLGAALGAMVLTGALLVGDCVKATLRQTA